MTPLTQLIADLEAAPEGSRELDERIARALDIGGTIIPEWSTSLDAALTLVPEGWFVDGDQTHQYVDGQWQWGLYHQDEELAVHGWCKPSPALALCIAALYARAQQSSTEAA